jgi:hypothetical protein
MIQPKYTLQPCSGVSRLGIPKGHLYVVLDEGLNELGIITKEGAFKKYGETNCFVSPDDTICPICFEFNMGKLVQKIDLPLIE